MYCPVDLKKIFKIINDVFCLALKLLFRLLLLIIRKLKREDFNN